MLKIAHVSKTENIYTLENHNMLTHFLVVTNPLLGSRALVMGKMGRVVTCFLNKECLLWAENFREYLLTVTFSKKLRNFLL